MKHARPDYDRIQDPAGLIPEDEPVFLLRGQDIFAPGAIREWAFIAESDGAAPEIVQKARDQAKLMEVWQRKRRQKIPDLPYEKR
jgi:hypothetical protein